MSPPFQGAHASAADYPVLTSIKMSFYLREDHISLSYVTVRCTVPADTAK